MFCVPFVRDLAFDHLVGPDKDSHTVQVHVLKLKHKTERCVDDDLTQVVRGADQVKQMAMRNKVPVWGFV